MPSTAKQSPKSRLPWAESLPVQENLKRIHVWAEDLLDMATDDDPPEARAYYARARMLRGHDVIEALVLYRNIGLHNARQLLFAGTEDWGLIHLYVKLNMFLATHGVIEKRWPKAKVA